MAANADDNIERLLSGAEVLGMPVDPEWIDKFMQSIFSRDYDVAREVLRKAICCGVGMKVAGQYTTVLEDFLQKRDSIENPEVFDRKGICEVRHINEETGRGLVTPRFAGWNDELFRELPLVYMQSPVSKRAVLVCSACLAPVGSLATQLSHLGMTAPPGADSISAAPLRVPASHATPCEDNSSPTPPMYQVVRCKGSGCGEVFCSEVCRDWAWEETQHAELCAGKLSPESLEAFRDLEQYADRCDQEHLLLLAHATAQMLRLLRRGAKLEDVLHRHAQQFISKPYDDEILAELAGETVQQRQSQVAYVELCLLRIFKADEELVAPLLQTELLSGLLGTFELVNMGVSLSHPLNAKAQRQRVADLLDWPSLKRVKQIQSHVADEVSSDDEANSQPSEGGEIEETEETDAATEEERARAAAVADGLFANIVGTALVESIAFTNHSCLPNCRIEFATRADSSAIIRIGDGAADSEEDSDAAKTELSPGLWVFGLAHRPMMPGDEVVMSYVPAVVGKPLAERQKRMKKFGFPCRCRSCVTSEMLVAEGDDQ
eukprot:TRINITY_DN70298_c0_g1_i1.p1 TRINITY_DN70298_c0_g1~~TRINITY_DN70298_c0_g1_i1.p1  ORF type:complete len:568 (-),score=117.15 TRINITY_DN70298_c0_g1_i1:26-1669(-)